jgi:hypothetical protein
MAREDPRRHRNERGDRVGLHGAHNAFAPVPLHDLQRPLRPFSPQWSELAVGAFAVMCVIAFAVMCVAPAAVVGLLLQLEAALPNANRCASGSGASECTVEAADPSRTP